MQQRQRGPGAVDATARERLASVCVAESLTHPSSPHPPIPISPTSAGALLGTVNGSVVEVTNSFGIYHKTTQDEVRRADGSARCRAPSRGFLPRPPLFPRPPISLNTSRASAPLTLPFTRRS